jgi:hypothetical protein
MKSTRHIQLLAAVSLALTILPAIEAEPRCPGNTASVTPRFVQHALIVNPEAIPDCLKSRICGNFLSPAERLARCPACH